MNELPTMTDQEILDRVGGRSFERGRGYFRSGAIFDARRQGMTLKARCRGSQPEAYQVQVTFDAGGIAAAGCTCPVGGGGYCKHVAALLFTWQATPERFRETEDLDAALARRTREELIALVKQMLRQEPDLESLLETPLPVPGQRHGPLHPETFRRQAAVAFHRAGDEWGAAVRAAEDLLAITAIGDGFLEQQDYAAAIVVYEAVAQEVLDQFESYQDENGSLYRVIRACVAGLGQCLAGEEIDRETRATIIRLLFDIYRLDMKMGDVGLARGATDLLLEQTTPEERRAVAGWVREALPKGTEWGAEYRRRAYGTFLLDLEAETLDDEGFLQICREIGRVTDLVDRLLELGRRDEAVAEVGRVEDHTLVELADLFVQHGHGEVAERWMAARAGSTQGTSVLAWLKKRYLARGDQAAALELAETIFLKRPDLEEYQEIRALAWPLGQWEKLRPKLMVVIAAPQHHDLRVHIHLDEGEIDQALAAVKPEPRARSGFGYGWGHGYVDALRLEVAEAAEALRPRAAVELYQHEAESLIEQRGRGNYQEACSLLAKARPLYERLGETEAWEQYITQLRERHRSLRALKEELASAHL